MQKVLIWTLRALLYGFAAWLGLWVIFPAVGGGALGMLLAAPTATAAILLDVFFSAWILQESAEKVAVRRILRVDQLLSGKKRTLPPPRSKRHLPK